jgi:hypothetical protein
MVMKNIQFKINTLLLDELEIENKIYTIVDLRKELDSKTYNKKIMLSSNLKKILLCTSNHIGIDKLINIIVSNYIEKIDYPNCSYYSYDQKPNFSIYKKVEYTTI